MRKGSFEDMILNPDALYRRLKRGEFFKPDTTVGQTNLTLARALARAYGQEELLDRAEVDQPSTAFPPAVPDVTSGLEDVQLNRGGEALMELKY